jgi:hypothetical protein
MKQSNETAIGFGQVPGGRATRWTMKCDRCGGWIRKNFSTKTQARAFEKKHLQEGTHQEPLAHKQP